MTPLRVLLVEDEEDDSLLVTLALEEGGYDLHTRRVDTEALLRQALGEASWDIVLSDYYLPTFSAQGTLRVLREVAPELPVIVVSGTVGEDIAVETLKLGAADYLLKQNLTRLVPAVTRALEVAEAQRRQSRLEQMNSLILESSLDLICTLDTDGRFMEVGAASRAMLDREPTELIGHPFRELAHPDDLAALEAAFATALAGRNVRDFECRFLHRSGHGVDLTWSIAPSRLGGVIVGIGHDVSARKQAEQRLRYLATHDDLTDLPNRHLINDRIVQAIAHAQRGGPRIALLYIDLDRFKVVNDGHGHPFGDAVLKAVGAHLQALVRHADSVARLGGDEFMILLTDVHRPADAELVARKVIDRLGQPLDVQGRTVHLSGSVGVAVFPDDGDSAETLIEHADVAMYRAKDLGRNTYQFFTRAMSEETRRRVELETRLRSAASAGQLQLVYQPKVHLESGRIIGCEALLRWQHPELGAVSPAHFIPVAEDSGLIVSIGDWVLRSAALQGKAWFDAGVPRTCIAVNLSARQFLQQDVVAWVSRTLEETGLPADWLELELTESLIAQDIDKVTDTIDRLKAIGVTFSIDDFGTGYSSLNYLRRFRVDSLKIDQSFVRNMLTEAGDATIVRAVISLAHSLRFEVIAEGVETAQQCDLLRQLHCDQIQGYHFSRPLPAPQFEAMLRGDQRLPRAT